MLDFQSMASKQGTNFAEQCLLAFQGAGFEIKHVGKTFKDIGVEIDAIVTNYPGISFPWEFKGSYQGKRPGLLRTDTVKKAVCNGFLFANSEYGLMFPPLFLMSSHLPVRNSPFVMLDNALRMGVIGDVVSSMDHTFISWLYTAEEEDIQALLASHREFGFTCHPHMQGVEAKPPKRKRGKPKLPHPKKEYVQLTLV